MPPSVPEGLELSLSRAPVLNGEEGRLGEWMKMLNDRLDEAVATLPRERVAFEATFSHIEADGSTWMYHLTLCHRDSPGLIPDNPVDADHLAFAKATKHRGWEELEPRLLLMPGQVRSAVIQATESPGSSAPLP